MLNLLARPESRFHPSMISEYFVVAAFVFPKRFCAKKTILSEVDLLTFLHNIIQSEKILLFVKKQQFSSLLSKMMKIEKNFF